MQQSSSINTVSQSCTKALFVFEQNVNMLIPMSFLALTELRAAITDVNVASKKVSKILPSEGLQLTRSLEDINVALCKVTTCLEQHYKAIQWQVVMLVTYAEAYLQDVLEAAATVGPDLMAKSEQSASYCEVINAISLEQLASELRQKWARSWLNNGGPNLWIKQLTKMGVCSYPADLATKLEYIWGIRHVVVHANGLATPDFLRRHPSGAKVVGDRLLIKPEEFTSYVSAVSMFVQSTDRYFLRRYPLLSNHSQT